MKKFKEPILVTRAMLPPIEDYVEKLKEIWKTNWLTNQGALYREFEVGIQNYLGVGNATLYVNGHLALDIAIKSLNLTGEVITTPFTFVSTTHAIVMNGLTPIFCDIKYSDYTIDENKIEYLITEKTSAIIPVHVYGMPCNIQKIEQIAKKYNLRVIYDAAHAFGVKVRGEGIGNFGDISMFSFHATKVFNAIEGGALTYNDSTYKEQLEQIRNFGFEGYESVKRIGLNAKMNEFQAAMGLANLDFVDAAIERRKEIVNLYRKLLKEMEGIKILADMDDVQHNYAYMPILIDEELFALNRNELYEKLKEYNVFARKYFYPLTNELECYKGIYTNLDLSIAKFVSERILTLPLYPELTDEEVNNIVDIIKHIKISSN